MTHNSLIYQLWLNSLVLLCFLQSNAVKRDIVFLLDGSDNTRDGFQEIKLFVKSIVESLSVSESQDRVSVVQFADKTEVNFDLNSHKAKNDTLNAIDNLRHKGGRRLNVGAALQFVRHSVFTSSTGSRRLEGVPQILILLTSKPSTDSVRGPAFALKEHEIVSVGIGVGNANLSELEMIAFKPGFTYKVTDFSMLRSIQSQLGATLNMNKDTEETLNGISDLRDIVFLLDGSDESRNGLPAIREFIRRTAEELDIEEDKVRVAVVQYSDDPKIYFNLKTHRSKKAIIYAVRSLRHKGGRPRNTGAALQFVQDHVFTASSGSRRLEGVPQILFLLTGGKSSDDVSGAALSLKQIGVLSFAIGMKNAKQEELQKIAFSSRFVFNLPVFGELLSIQPEIAAFVKAEIQTEPPTVVGKKDIVFLLDGSDVTRSDFPAMKNFVKRVVDALNVGENKDHVSVVQYSRDPQTDFSLNTYTEKQDVVAAVQQLNHKGGSLLNTGAALDYVRNNAFAESSGSRYQEGVPQILILLSGGRSQDDVASAAAALKRDKVVPFCVGTRNADILEQQMIAHNPSYAFSVMRFDNVGSIYPQLVSLVKRVPRQQPRLKAQNVSAVQAESIQRDIVFLLDSSDEMQNDFRAMLGFVERMVEKLNVDEDKDRVSVVQYSREPNVEFSLNTFQTKQKDDVLDAVRGLRHKGGYPHNIGAALQYVRDYIFTSDSGSRLHEGVPQILILLSGGRSEDDIRTPVRMLKEMGVISIAIGTTDADTLELQTISHEPNYAFSINDYEELPTAKQDLPAENHIAFVSTSFVFVADSKKQDVVFLIDGSYDSRNGFEEIRGFIGKIVESLNLDENRDRVAVVQYNRDATANFYLNSYSSKNDVLNSIGTMRHKFGRPLNIGKALDFVRDSVFAASVGGRRAESVPQYLYLFSGGRSGDDVRGPAQSLKENGIKTFSIGTKNADTLEMQTISFTPAHYFHVTNFNNLQSIHPSVEATLRGVKETTEFPTVIDVLYINIKSADIVFLLDGSNDMRASERQILDFVREIVKQIEIGPSKVQVALTQYSTEPTTDFLLNTYSQKDDVLSHLSNVNLKGGTSLNTGVALDYVKNSVFSASSGSRAQQGVPQILILLSGRKSGDDVSGAVDRLRNAGIILYSIGLNNADRLEIEQLAHSPQAKYFIKEISDFPLVREQLLSTITSHKDTVTPGVDKVAVVQYSNNAELSFNLNTYNTRDDVLKHVASLQPKGGRPQNIGAALQFVKDKVLVSNAGGRRHEGAKQILVMLAGGRSRDSPRGPARMLKAAGVVTFAIGSRMANSAEMQVISSDPNYAYSVPDFVNLSRIQQSLMSQLTQMGVEEETKEGKNLDYLKNY
uniref:VWFA domain-containing protein n=1 Tax=Sparus aurata TaxID=8175 RepID=A0A671VB72_SPAAU